MTVHTHGDFIVLPIGKPCYQHPDLISHSVTLSWHWGNQSFPYSNNAEHLDRKRQVSVGCHWFYNIPYTISVLYWLHQSAQSSLVIGGATCIMFYITMYINIIIIPFHIVILTYYAMLSAGSKKLGDNLELTGLPVGQPYRVPMSVHWDNSVLELMAPLDVASA